MSLIMIDETGIQGRDVCQFNCLLHLPLLRFLIPALCHVTPSASVPFACIAWYWYTYRPAGFKAMPVKLAKVRVIAAELAVAAGVRNGAARRGSSGVGPRGPATEPDEAHCLPCSLLRFTFTQTECFSISSQFNERPANSQAIPCASQLFLAHTGAALRCPGVTLHLERDRGAPRRHVFLPSL